MDIVIIINNRGGWNNRGRLDGVEKMCRRFLSKHNAFFFLFQQMGKYSLHNLIQEN